jgi:hypothetical protein
MNQDSKLSVDGILKNVKNVGHSVDVAGVKDKAVRAKDMVTEKVERFSKKNENQEEPENQEESEKEEKIKINDELQNVINEYNLTYTLYSDSGLALFRKRERAIDLIMIVETIVNSIANHPKAFDTEMKEIKSNREKFVDTTEYIDRELRAAQKSAVGAGAGVAAGAAVVSLAPSAAMWIATTYGVASTGTAISALSGAAATNAALAWLGGGAVAAGGGGMVAGEAFLALAGPIGWGIAGVSLLTSIILFSRKKMKMNAEKIKEIEDIKKNTGTLKCTKEKLEALIDSTEKLRVLLDGMVKENMFLYGADYVTLDDEKKRILGGLVNNTKALSSLLGKSVDE